MVSPKVQCGIPFVSMLIEIKVRSGSLIRVQLQSNKPKIGLDDHQNKIKLLHIFMWCHYNVMLINDH
jgi:hypothetical protein